MAKNRVIAAMSGGVDSSVAAALLKEQGYDVVGITMQIWPNDESAEEAARFGGCCSLAAVTDAKKVASKLNIPHYVLNFRKVFEEKVIADFVKEYALGRTPNPCIRCNQHIKFETLLKRAKELDASFIATGHYARIVKNKVEYVLKKGIDPKKDQSYVLYTMNQGHLPRVLMPLGNFRKEETRKKAKERELPVAEKGESQEICFIPNDNYREFLKSRGTKIIKPGSILNSQGKVLGEHQGISFYTIGQRKGLGISLGKSLYVKAINKEENALIVGEEEEIYSGQLIASNVNYVSEPLAKSARLKVKIRYNMREQPALVTYLGDGKVKVEFDEPQWAPTPGQAVVFYDAENVIGGGIISSAC